MNNCHRIRELIGPYIYKELNDNENSLVETHLAVCSGCQAEFFIACEAVVAQVPINTLKLSPEASARITAALEQKTIQVLAERLHPHQIYRRMAILALMGTLTLMLGVLIGYHLPRLPREHLSSQTSETTFVPETERSAPPQPDQINKPTTYPSETRSPQDIVTPASEKAVVSSPTPSSHRRARTPIHPTKILAPTIQQVLRPSCPLGLDDVQVAEVVQVESTE